MDSFYKNCSTLNTQPEIYNKSIFGNTDILLTIDP